MLKKIYERDNFGKVKLEFMHWLHSSEVPSLGWKQCQESKAQLKPLWAPCVSRGSVGLQGRAPRAVFLLLMRTCSLNTTFITGQNDATVWKLAPCFPQQALGAFIGVQSVCRQRC